jgi:hypothetical protein
VVGGRQVFTHYEFEIKNKYLFSPAISKYATTATTATTLSFYI